MSPFNALAKIQFTKLGMYQGSFEKKNYCVHILIYVFIYSYRQHVCHDAYI